MNIIKQGKRIVIFGEEISAPLKLDNRPYSLEGTKFGMELLEAENFTLPEKLYDNEKDFRERVLKSYKTLNKNVGVLLIGEKGMGKSVVAKLLAQEANQPIIMITKPISMKHDFAAFISSIEADVTILVDEFDKIVQFPGSHEDKEYHEQDSFLSFMDGVVTSKFKRLFIFTTNDAIDDKFINRPSRIRYKKNFRYLNENTFNMIVDDKLIKKEYKQDLLDNLSIYEANIDLLCTIIEEINIQDKPYSEFKEDFNHESLIYKYDRYRQQPGGHFEYVDCIETRRRIDKKDTYLEGDQIKIVDFREDFLIYKTWEMVNRIGGKQEKAEVVYKLKEAKLKLTYGYVD